MKKVRFFTFLLSLLAITLALFLACKIKEPIDRARSIENIESRVVRKLKIIREVQKEYYQSHGKYSGNWNELINYVNSGISYTTSQRDSLAERPVEEKYLGKLSIRITDTLDAQPVLTKLMKKYPDFDPSTLALVPGKSFTFLLTAKTLDMNGIPVEVVKVTDPKPEDRSRNPNHPYLNRQNLHFGSLNKASLEGNWTLTDI